MNPKGLDPVDCQVIIVGAGPVGLTLANLLGVMGIGTRVVERQSGLAGEARAVALDDEAMRVIQAAGLVEAIAPTLLMGYDHRLYGRKGQLLLTVDPASRENGYPKRNRFHQPELERCLLEGLDRFDKVEVAFGHLLETMTIEPGQVRIQVRQGDHAREMTCQFLIGCDGGSSAVRRLAGIDMIGDSHPEPWIVIDTEDNPDTARYSRAIGDPSRPSVNVPGVEGRRRYEFMLLPGEDPKTAIGDEAVRALLAPHCDTDRVRVTRRVVYNFHSLIAERFSQDDRIFLAGDAAHMMPPFQGQGMNSGIRDASMLAWRLETVLAGRLDARVLASYEQERRPHVSAMIALSARVGRILMTRNPARALVRDLAFALLAGFPKSAGYLRNMRFKPRAATSKGYFLPDASALAGQLFPQPDLLAADGSMVKLDHVLGPGFALLHLRDGANPIDDRFHHPFWTALAARQVLVLPGGLAASASSCDVVLGDIGGDVRRWTRTEGPLTLLLRPDRYVAAVIAPGMEADAVERLSQWA